MFRGLFTIAAAPADRPGLVVQLAARVAERTRVLAEVNESLKQEIAQRKKAEAALIQAQKMEAVGQLAGGVAHDFNNLLQIIVGNIETLQRKLPTDLQRLRRAADHAMAGARRATNLTQHLLAFSRKARFEVARGGGVGFDALERERCDVEIAQQVVAQPIVLQAGGLQIGTQLGVVGAAEVFGGLEFEDDGAVGLEPGLQQPQALHRRCPWHPATRDPQPFRP